VPFGIDKALFDPSRRDASVRAAWLERCGAPPDARLVVSVGRHHPEKRLHVVAAAVAQAQAQSGKAIALVLVGDGPLRFLVERWTKAVPHALVAGFVDSREHMAATLASADAVLHASAAETFGLSVAEAICSGTPVVVPDSGGASDLADPSYAESYTTGDAGDAARALLALLDRDPKGLREACIKRGRARIAPAAQHFDDLFALYAKLVG
jgi:alpha-1,6-mannosyltransferase